MKKMSQWQKDVKKALITKDMTLKQLAEKIGYSVTTVSCVISGRYSNSSYQSIVNDINAVLGTSGLPERISTPSNEWCETVRIELIKHGRMSISQLARELNISRDSLSLVINGRMMNDEIVSAVSSFLDIKVPAIPSANI